MKKILIFALCSLLSLNVLSSNLDKMLEQIRNDNVYGPAPISGANRNDFSKRMQNDEDRMNRRVSEWKNNRGITDDNAFINKKKSKGELFEWADLEKKRREVMRALGLNVKKGIVEKSRKGEAVSKYVDLFSISRYKAELLVELMNLTRAVADKEIKRANAKKRKAKKK